MTNWSRNPRRPERGQILASVVLHLLVLAAAWWAHRAADRPIEYLSYEMQIVSAADLEPVEEATLQAPEEVQTPEDEPEPPEEAEPEPPPPDPEPDPEVPPDPEPPEEDPPEQEDPPEEEQQEEEQAEVTATDQEEEPEEEASADVAMRTEGLQRDYPAYYRNIVAQIQACLRWDRGGTWTTVLRFTIESDGQVPGASIEVRERSGSAPFDLAAVGAVECAGSGRLDPLPEDLPYDELPIQFTFSPAGAPGR